MAQLLAQPQPLVSCQMVSSYSQTAKLSPHGLCSSFCFWCEPAYKHFYILLAAGASLLGVMPSSREVASLGLAVLSAATAAEDPLVSAGVTSVAGSSIGGKEVCSVVDPSAAKSSRSAECVGSSAGFSLGHGFSLIPPKLVQKILKWEYVRALARQFRAGSTVKGAPLVPQNLPRREILRKIGRSWWLG